MNRKNKFYFFVVVLLFQGILLTSCAPTLTSESSTSSQNMTPQGGQAVPVDMWPDLTDLGGAEIIIAEDNAWPPFAYIDKETKEPKGFDYEFFDEICKRINCKPVFKEFAWEGLFEAGIAGEWDVTCWGATLTLERSKIIDWSDPIMEYGEIILVRKDSPKFSNAEELEASAAILAATTGSTEAMYSVNLVGEDRVILLETDDMPVVALISGDVDALIYDETAAMGVLMEYGDELEISGRVSTGLFIALPMSPASPYQVAINHAINEMWADGTMDTLQKKWFPALGKE